MPHLLMIDQNQADLTRDELGLIVSGGYGVRLFKALTIPLGSLVGL